LGAPVSANAQPAPAKKVCCQCGIDVSHITRSKDQFGNYYCASCVQKVNVVKHEPFRPDPESKRSKASPVRPASQPAATAAEKDDLALSPAEGEPPQVILAPEAGQPGRLPAQVVFRPAGYLQWPNHCVGCFAENPQQVLRLGVAPATEFGSAAKMGKLSSILHGLTVRLKLSGRLETGHYRLPICASCRGKLSDGDVAALAGQTDNVEPPPYRVQTALLTREIDQRCIVLGFCSQEYAGAFRQANAAAVFDSVEACVAAAREKAQLAAQAAAEARVELGGTAFQAVVGHGQDARATGGTPQTAQPAAQKEASPQTLILERPPAAPLALPSPPRGEGRGEGAPALSPSDATPPALPAVTFLDEVRSLSAKPEDSGEEPGPPLGDSLPPPVVAQASSLPDRHDGGPTVAQASSLPGGNAPPAASRAPLEEQVLELLQGQPQTDGLSVTPEITPQELAAATRACQVPNSECVLALLDCTASGSAEDALVFGCQGIYFHNGAGSRSAGPGAISYAEFPRRLFGGAPHPTLSPGGRGEGEGAGEVDLGGGQFLNLGGCPVPPGRIVALLQAVKELVARRTRRHTTSSQPPVPPRMPETLPLLDDLRQLAKTHLPEGPIKILGAATWEAEDTLGARLGTLLVRKGAAAAAKERRAGLIAIMADKLFVADLGTAGNGEITLAGLKELGPAKVKSCRLRALRGQCTESPAAIVLELRGDIELKAVFSASCGNDNPAKAVEIATAIRCA